MKKFATMAISVGLIGTMIAGGSLAYLQDTDSDVNVMTLGNVKIEQFEKERVFDANGNVTGMQDFTQGQALLPAVVTNGSGNEAWAPNSGVDINYGDYIDGAVGGNGTWQNLNNVMDKFVFVKNTGKTDAYYRTIIAYEAETTVEMVNSYNQDMIHFNINGNNRFVWDETVIEDVEIKGVKYNVFSALYTDVLKPGEISRPSLLQVGMDQIATNEYFAQFGDTYDILVLSQAVQTAGFDNAETALEAAFGEVNEVNVAEWFGGMYIPDYSLEEAVIEEGVITLADGETRVLTNCDAPVTVDGKGTLYLRDVEIADTLTIEGENIKLVVEGDVSVTSTDGSAITGKKLNISGTPGATLTAIAGDQKGAFGIGGMTTTEISIKDLTIKEVRGGFDGEIGTDTKYYKDAPEGGSAIGSGYNGATITLNNVHIEKAIGGSKSAGIGAKYHVGVNVTINDSTIDYVEGGATAAGIGGSRISSGCTENGTSITINNSTVNAKGGAYGAGIGSGYDTHCQKNQPATTINIKGDSVINATGGKYAAGVGTGYHVASLAGAIDNTVTVNAKSGDKFYKDAYTQAQDIGFGVVDPTREGSTAGSLTYEGEIIYLPSVGNN